MTEMEVFRQGFGEEEREFCGLILGVLAGVCVA